jgi:hypothetical protein
MRDKRKTDQSVANLAGARGMVLGAAVVAFGVIAFGAYSFASGSDQPRMAASTPVSTAEIRTTPDNGAREMPPPVAPSNSP